MLSGCMVVSGEGWGRPCEEHIQVDTSAAASLALTTAAVEAFMSDGAAAAAGITATGAACTTAAAAACGALRGQKAAGGPVSGPGGLGAVGRALQGW